MNLTIDTKHLQKKTTGASTKILYKHSLVFSPRRKNGGKKMTVSRNMQNTAKFKTATKTGQKSNTTRQQQQQKCQGEKSKNAKDEIR